MVEIGPYIEYCGQSYVRESYVIQCVVVAWLAYGLFCVLFDIIRYFWKKHRSQSHPRAEKCPVGSNSADCFDQIYV